MLQNNIKNLYLIDIGQFLSFKQSSKDCGTSLIHQHDMLYVDIQYIKDQR